MADSFDELTGYRHQFETLVDLLRYRTLHQPHKTAFTFLTDGETPSRHLTYNELDGLARAIAAQLQSLDATGERALLLYPPGLEFIAAFFGCLYAGVIAVPAYPPRPNQKLSRLQVILEDSQATFALTTTSLLSNIERRFTQEPTLTPIKWITTDTLNHTITSNWQEPTCNPNTLAFLQYTSGSTGIPKGVMITHGNLLYNSALINRCFEDTPDSQGVSWLPPYHDMGLIGGVLQPLYVGAPMILMSPVDFLQKPFRWLQAISRYKATTSGGPNFAYDLCVRKITPQQRETLDLSSWEFAFTGAEPVRAKTLERFAATFASCGFRWEAFYPCYGMAETTLFIAGGVKSAPPVFCQVDGKALEQNQVVPLQDKENSRTLVGCGKTWLDEKIAIVNPESLLRCEEGQVGEIWVSGPSVAQGYWQRPEATEQTFNAYLANTNEEPFLRTGDLGFVQDGELFITGRLKDLIIIRGRNHYPQDIELTVEQSHPALRPGCGAAFSVEVDDSERLVIVQEVERSYLRKLDVDDVVEAIRRAISQHYELQVDAVVLLKTGSIPKTSSGKIQRHACKTGFLDNSLMVVGIWKSAIWEPQVLEHTDKFVENIPVSPRPRVPASPEITPPLPLSPSPQPLTDDLIAWLRSYANERINSRIIDERRCIPPYIVLDFGNRGLLGMQVPRSYGGLELSNRDMLRIMEQLGAIDPTLSLFVGLSNILGIRPILNYATPTVKDELLPLLATGRELAAFALTEPIAGSNPQAISSSAIPDGNGGWRLQGTKIWSGSAAWAGAINVFVQNIDNSGKGSGVSGFVVRQGTQGLRQGPEALTMGMRGMIQNTIYFEDVPVTPENLLGAPGKGMNAAQDAMMYGRLAIGASSVGGMKRCAQLMLRYATVRSISTGRLLDNPTTLTRLSDLTAAITTVETLIAKIAELLDTGHIVPVDAYVVAKIAGPEFLWQAADHLVQLLGGRGYIETNIAPQILRDARILRIFEGPTETLTMFLGSRVINQSEELHQFLCDRLNSKSVSEHLKVAAVQINDRCTGTHAPFSDRTSAIRWAYTLTGEVALYAILLAALQESAQRNVSERCDRAIAWTTLKFEQTLTKALTGTPAESVLMNANQTTDLISSYTETIGNLEQTLAGEDHELDNLLKLQNSAQPPKKSPPTPPPQPTNTPSVTSATPSVAKSIQTWMVEWLVKELKLPTHSIDTTKSFADYGLDSVTAVELADAIQDWLGVTLSPTLAYDYPTIESMAQYLAKESTLQNSKGVTPHYVNTIQNSELKDVNDKNIEDFSLSSETETSPSSGDEEVDQLLSELGNLSEEEQENILGKL